MFDNQRQQAKPIGQLQRIQRNVVGGFRIKGKKQRSNQRIHITAC